MINLLNGEVFIFGRRPRPRLARSRWFVAAVVLLRVLGALVAMQASGVPHFAIDLMELHEERDDGAPCDDEKHGCPPGCPSCHSACGFLASLPSTPIAEVAPEPHELDSSTASITDDCDLPSGEHTSVWRPPRPALSA